MQSESTIYIVEISSSSRVTAQMREACPRFREDCGEDVGVLGGGPFFANDTLKVDAFAKSVKLTAAAGFDLKNL